MPQLDESPSAGCGYMTNDEDRSYWCVRGKILGHDMVCPECGGYGMPVKVLTAELERLRKLLFAITAYEKQSASILSGLSLEAIEKARLDYAALKADAERYRWLRDNKFNSISVSSGDHRTSYVTAEQYINGEGGPQAEFFDGIEEAERKAIVERNELWHIQIYPDTPIGFNLFFGATLDSAIDQAREPVEE